MNTKEEKFLVCRDETIEYSRTSVRVKHPRPFGSVQKYFVGTFTNAWILFCIIKKIDKSGFMEVYDA